MNSRSNMSLVKIALAGTTAVLVFPVKIIPNSKLCRCRPNPQRGDSASKLIQAPNMTVAQVDYDSAPCPISALRGVKVVIFTLTTKAASTQNPLIDASINAGVTRSIPSEFGNDTTNSNIATLPFYSAKVATLNYLREKVQSHKLQLDSVFYRRLARVGTRKSDSK